MEDHGVALSSHHFSVAAIPELAKSLTHVQKTLLDAVWNRYVDSGSPFPIRSLPKIIGKQSIEKAIEGLNGSLLYETMEQSDRYCKLTIYGALLTEYGDVLAAHLVRLLDFVKELYEKDNFIKEISVNQIKNRLGFSDAETQRLFRLLTLGLPPGMPIHLSNYGPDGREWALAITDDVLGLFSSDDSVAYLDGRLSAGYRLEEPYSYNERSTNLLKSDALHNSQHDFPGNEISKDEAPDPIDTKLELLNTYIEMGDTKGAQELSLEIRNKGNPTQQRSAQTLLEKLNHLKKQDMPATRAPRKKKVKPRTIVPAHASASSDLSATRTETEAVSDLLDRKRLTLALYRLLTEREDDHPFAIGLFGHWGTGKSSQVNFLQEELKKTGKPEIIVAEFNAWQNEKATNLAAMLAQAVVDGLVADKGIWARLKLAVQLAVLRHSNTRKALERDWRSLKAWLPWTCVLLPNIFLLFSLALLLWWVPLPGAVLATVYKVMTWATVTLASVYHFMRSHLTDLFKRMDMKQSLSLLSLPDYSAHRGLILEIHRTLRDLCTLCLNGNTPKEGSYLLLVVDDLDRCGVDTVKDVLDAVRLVACIPRVVTLVAIDERMAFAAVEKHYHQFGHAGRPPALVARDYLAKVLQISVTLPDVGQGGISSYVDRMIFGDIGQSPVMRTTGASGKISARSAENRNGETLSSIQPIIMQNAKSAEVTTLPSEQILLSESPTTATVNQVPPLQSSLPMEKELFKELAQAYNFSNPRLLWRHYMAWKLLKSLTLGTTYVLEEVETPMRLLFWREWLHQLPYGQREVYSDWMTNAPGQNKPQGMPSAIYDTVKLRLRPIWEEAKPLIGVVDAVLLPSSPSEGASAGKLQRKARSEALES